MLFTYSVVQIMTILEATDRLDADEIVGYIKSRQLEDGSFAGDEFGEVDTRFSYCAVGALALLGRLDDIDKGRTAEFIDACRNFDGGYGVTPGCESHAGQIFCSVAALYILGRKDLLDVPRLGEWLAWRQLPGGGLNGRPEKLEDVCYTWWVLSALEIINPQLDWISKPALTQFILDCQDPVTGGIADRPGDVPDVFHTLFGLAGLSLMAHEHFQLEPIDPAYCMPVRCLRPKAL